MNRVALQLFAVGICFAIGQALQCYYCPIGIGSMCITTQVTCNNNEQCFSGVGTAVKLLSIKRKGCLAVTDCNKTQDVNFPDNSSTVYSMTKTCCSTDLCNTAPGLPGASGLSLAFATIAALFVANILV